MPPATVTIESVQRLSMSSVGSAVPSVPIEAPRWVKINLVFKKSLKIFLLLLLSGFFEERPTQ